MSAVLAARWIAVDRTPPGWDQSHYLWVGLRYVDAFWREGAGGLIQAVFAVDRFYPPGYPALLFPFMAVLGPSIQSALIANLCVYIVLLLSVAAIARLLFGRAAGLIAMSVTATVPFLLVLQHQVLVDLAAVTWASLSVLAMLRSAHFTRATPAALAGVFAGIGLLTKATVLVFLAGPIIVIGLRAALRVRSLPTRDRMRVAANAGLMVALAAALAAPWYVINWDTTVAYLQSATVGELAVGAGPADPLDPVAITTVGVRLLGDLSLSLAAVMVVLGAVLLGCRLWPSIARTPAVTNRSRRGWAWLLLASWVAVPLAVLVDAHNQDPRYAVAVFPGLALVFAGLCSIAGRWVRLAAVAAVLGLGLAQVGLAQLPSDSAPPNGFVLSLSAGAAGSLVAFAPAYPAANPAADEGTPVMRALEAAARGRPARVLVAQEDRVFNINTLTWLAATRHDRFTFDRPNLLTGDPGELNAYDLAVYVSAPEVAQRNPDRRLQILNQKTATSVFGDQLFTLFGRGRREVATAGATVWVLQR